MIFGKTRLPKIPNNPAMLVDSLTAILRRIRHVSEVVLRRNRHVKRHVGHDAIDTSTISQFSDLSTAISAYLGDLLSK